MRRWAAGVEYVGSGYAGWQRLPNQITAQATLEAALSRVANHPIEVVCAGRTDSGVHARQQVVHFDTAAERDEHAWVLGCNSLLPEDLSLRWVKPVDRSFHARFGAIARGYHYRIHNDRGRSALWARRAGWWPQTLDAEAMHRAAQCLVGEHDFSAFRSSHCQAPSAIRRVTAISVKRSMDQIAIDVVGNAFLHHMVRNIVGSLAEVGLQRRSEDWVATVLAQRDRRLAGMTAPAGGLYFLGPTYADVFALPPPPPAPIFP